MYGYLGDDLETNNNQLSEVSGDDDLGDETDEQSKSIISGYIPNGNDNIDIDMDTPGHNNDDNQNDNDNDDDDNESENSDNEGSQSDPEQSQSPAPVKPQRRSARLQTQRKKNMNTEASESDSESESESEQPAPKTPTKRRGRPRKQPQASTTKSPTVHSRRRKTTTTTKKTGSNSSSKRRSMLDINYHPNSIDEIRQTLLKLTENQQYLYIDEIVKQDKNSKYKFLHIEFAEWKRQRRLDRPYIAKYGYDQSEYYRSLSKRMLF